ncbi:MAG: alanine--glyoxylate aminotransferase family protein [Anaerolineales bacterium]|nr:alanine--glyoxylate aminotransferase family protein [Anaerolineales bacterium]
MKNRTLLMIPGPIEFEPAVLAAMGAPTTSHVAADFIEAFGQSLERMRRVFMSENGQPFILAGSGTLAMDSVGANLVEPGDRVLVICTGYFGDRYAALLKRYGAQVDQVTAPVGGRPSLEDIEKALKQQKYKIVFVTHVDTSTGVIADVPGTATLAAQYGALSVVDGVCSIAGEELNMSAWGVDVALTASQKAIGVPPGLALFVVNPRAMQAFKGRKAPITNYYADWANWLPVMQAYEARQAGYFGTPAVNLVWALNVSLGQILEEGINARVERHRVLSNACKAAAAALRLNQVAIKPEWAANTMTALRYPPGITGAEFLPRVAKAGAYLAGGLHPDIKNEYFRIGHMGATKIGDVLATVGAIEFALIQCDYRFESGSGVSAASKAIFRT